MTTSLTPADIDVIPRFPARRQPARWQRAYARRLVAVDIAVVTASVFGAALAHGILDTALVGPGWLDVVGADGLTYAGVCGFLVVVWTIALAATGSRRSRVLGLGPGEFKAVFQSAAAVLVLLALLAIAFRLDFSRGFVLTALVLGLAGLIVARGSCRLWLWGRRRAGEFCARALVVGSHGPASQIATELRRHPSAGYQVVGAALSGSSAATIAGDVPVLGSIERLIAAVHECRADTVIVTDGHDLPPQKLRELSWSLEPGRQHLVIAPSLTDIAGPRIHARPVAGLPLVHVETPRYEGLDRFVKRGFDITVSATLLLLLALPLLFTALLVATSSPGGVFYAHERIGKRGEPFRMLKFRSMVPDADQRLKALLEAQGTAGQPLFKVANDPRVTPVGRFMRRYSIDEIPQLINVLRGDMSLVGPRPQVAGEVALYDDAAIRRLFVQPGMTGLWQVSGRSRLGWDESVRLDLFYVENWSLTTDIMILLKTVRAVVGSDGAI